LPCFHHKRLEFTVNMRRQDRQRKTNKKIKQETTGVPRAHVYGTCRQKWKTHAPFHITSSNWMSNTRDRSCCFQVRPATKKKKKKKRGK
jgi:hypothetical protein